MVCARWSTLVVGYYWLCVYVNGEKSVIDPVWLWQEDGIYVVASYTIVLIVLLVMIVIPSVKQRYLLKRILQQQRIQKGRQQRSQDIE